MIKVKKKQLLIKPTTYTKDCVAFQGFHHSFYDTYQTIWSLEEVTSLREFYQAVSTEKDLLTVKNVVDEFEKNILPKFGQFTKG